MQVNKYFGLSRYWFNQAIEYLKNEETKAYLPEVRKIQQKKHPEWAFDCPQRIREHAIADAVKAVKNAKSKFLKEKTYQNVKFRSKKNPSQVFGFDKQSLKENFVFPKKKFRSFFKSSENFNNVELEGIRIKCENDRFFLVIPEKRKIKQPENQRLPYVSIDPGVRTFATTFSPELITKIGDGDFNRIYRLCINVDKLISKISKAKSKQKGRMKKALNRLKWKIKDLINELHHKAAHFLVTRFEKIYLPTFETSEMVTKLKSKTARNMLTFAHFRFKSFLKAKAEEYSCQVIDVSEAYTSKTCSFCGKIHKIGSKSVLKCQCGIKIDRDINGARGILLKNLCEL